jgi:serine/threonine-protein kinase HipA
MSKNQLSIRLHGKPVGILEQTPSGKKKFTYLDNAAAPISLCMPIQEKPYDDLACEAFFGGLLPESDTAKQLIGKRYNISPHNSFSLLRAIGGDCAGAISCHGIDDPILSHEPIPLRGKIITEDVLYQHIKMLPQNPLFMDVEGLRLSLAGVQNKAAICLIDHQIAFPEDNCPTTHLLKPASPYFEGLVENEYFCLKIAAQMGLPVPAVELRKIKDITFLLIERYDRRIKEHFVERIHQEDFCQALSIVSSRKYQNEGGPSLENCFELLNNTSQPAIDRTSLISAVVFNYLISNRDAHGKNFSLLHKTPKDIRLAPFYDLVCTGVYPKLSSKMAMKIGKKYDAQYIFPDDWEQLCQHIHYRYSALALFVEKTADKLLKVAMHEKEQLKLEGIKSSVIEKISNVIKDNVERTQQLFVTKN